MCLQMILMDRVRGRLIYCIISPGFEAKQNILYAKRNDTKRKIPKICTDTYLTKCKPNKISLSAEIEELRLNSWVEQLGWNSWIEQLGFNNWIEQLRLNSWDGTTEIEQLTLNGWDWTAGIEQLGWTAELNSWDWTAENLIAEIDQLRLKAGIEQLGLNSLDWTVGIEQLRWNSWD